MVCIGICVRYYNSFAVHLEDRPEHECLSRFVAKFVEAEMEKVDRIMDLYMEYSDRLGSSRLARCCARVPSVPLRFSGIAKA